MNSILKVSNLSKTIDNKVIIKNLSFTIQPGEIFGFLGPNGSGKTTTIRMLVGLSDMTSGDVLVDGKSIASNYKEAISHVGAIVENPNLYGNLSGWKNLVHFSRMHKGVTKEKIQELLKLVELYHVKDKKVHTYSLGMRQRLGIAQALLHDPKLLILDEPTNGLDPKGIHEMREYLRTLAKEENLAIMISSHLLQEMELICDRFAIINNGEIISTQHMNQIDKNESNFFLEIDDVTKAHTLIQSEYDHSVKMVDKGLNIQISREEVADLCHFLYCNQIKVYQIIQVKKTLEERYLHLTELQKEGEVDVSPDSKRMDEVI